MSEIVEDLKGDLSRHGIWEDPKHPVSSAICRKLVENFEVALLSVVEGLELAKRHSDVSEATLKEITRLLEKALESLERTQELAEWLPQDITWPLDDALQWTRSKSNNLPEAAEILSRLARRKVGRPNKNRLYLAVFELMLQGPDTSLGIARRNVQPPISQENEPGLKAGIRKIKRLLRKHAPEFVIQFETLHPDRARMSMGNKSS